MSSLRSTTSNSWDYEVLNDLFIERDQQQIISIPLSTRICDDVWIWAEDVKGCYIVKSRYNLLMKRMRWQFLHPLLAGKVWKLRIPAKVRIFCGLLSLLVSLPDMTFEPDEFKFQSGALYAITNMKICFMSSFHAHLHVVCGIFQPFGSRLVAMVTLLVG